MCRSCATVNGIRSARLDDLPVGERMVDRHGDDPRLGADELGVELGVDVMPQHREIHEALGQAAVAAVQPHEPHGRVGVHAVPRAQHGGRVRAEGGPLVPDADDRTLAARVGDGTIELGEHAAGGRGERHPGFGRLDPARRAVHESGAELVLEGGERAGDCGLRHPESVGGGGERSFLVDGHEHAQLPHLQIHVFQRINARSIAFLTARIAA